METNLAHVRANVTDLQRAVEWDEQVLGFTVAAYWPEQDPIYCHFSKQGGATYSLSVDEGWGGRYNFSVEDPDALWAQLKDDPRVHVVEELFSTPYGSRKFTIADPDGNQLGFVRNA